MMTSKKMQKYSSKIEFRKYCKDKLLKYSKSIGHKTTDKKIIKEIQTIISKNKYRTILAYIPLSTEVNTFPLINRLRREGKVVFVPFMEHESFRVVKYRLPLEKKRFGIKEPRDSKQFKNKKIDLAIVPTLGVDISGCRIGFGKGMYDRFFQKEQKNIKNQIFVSRKLLINSKKITDEHDISARCIVSS